MERVPSEKYVEFCQDPNERLNTIFDRLEAVNEHLSQDFVGREFTNLDQLTGYWNFLQQEKRFFQRCAGRKFDYWTYDEPENSDPIKGLIFRGLIYEVAINESEDCVVNLGILCIQTDEMGKDNRQIIIFDRASMVGLETEKTMAYYGN